MQLKKKMKLWLKGRTEKRRSEYVAASNRAEIVNKEREFKKRVAVTMAEELNEDGMEIGKNIQKGKEKAL